MYTLVCCSDRICWLWLCNQPLQSSRSREPVNLAVGPGFTGTKALWVKDLPKIWKPSCIYYVVGIDCNDRSTTDDVEFCSSCGPCRPNICRWWTWGTVALIRTQSPSTQATSAPEDGSQFMRIASMREKTSAGGQESQRINSKTSSRKSHH
jgi:hypothetical protein